MTIVDLSGFERKALEVNKVQIVTYALGSGPPLVFLHGAGSFTGFDALRPLAAMRRVIISYHPGYGESGDDPTLDGMDDYVRTYMDLFDAMGLGSLDLMGFSLGGWMAAEFAIFQPARIRRLVLVAPAGLVVPEYPAPELSAITPPELPGYLAHDPAVALRFFPKGPDPEFAALVDREMAATGRLLAPNAQGDPKLARWAHRITPATLLLWGAEDRMRPAPQAKSWKRLLPDATLELVPGAGHLVLDERPESIKIVEAFLMKSRERESTSS
jgi:pimeloyl-ACP methyl ester carboxylesterase